jgi:hypothetical protein
MSVGSTPMKLERWRAGGDELGAAAAAAVAAAALRSSELVASTISGVVGHEDTHSCRGLFCWRVYLGWVDSAAVQCSYNPCRGCWVACKAAQSQTAGCQVVAPAFKTSEVTFMLVDAWFGGSLLPGRLNLLCTQRMHAVVTPGWLVFMGACRLGWSCKVPSNSMSMSQGFQQAVWCSSGVQLGGQQAAQGRWASLPHTQLWLTPKSSTACGSFSKTACWVVWAGVTQLHLVHNSCRNTSRTVRIDYRINRHAALVSLPVPPCSPLPSTRLCWSV